MFGWMRKNAAATIDQFANMVGWFGWGSSSGVQVNTESALSVTAFLCGARVIAEGLAQMPVRLVEATFDDKYGRETLRIAHEHPVHRLLSKRPNGWQTSYEFREGMVFCAVIAGGAIAIKNTVRGQVRELLPVPPGSWTVEQQSDWSLKVRVNYADKTHGIFEMSQVFYLRGVSLDGFRGLGVARLAREAIGLSIALEQQQARLAGNGGKPSGILSHKQKLSSDTVERLRNTWQQKFGQGGEGGIAVLDGDVSFFPLTMTSVDAQFLETRRFQIEEIARTLRVLPIMMMQADKASTYASAEQMFMMHVIHTLGPWVERFEQAANRDVLNNDDKYRVDLNERNLLRGNFKDQAEYYTKALGAGGQPAWMTQNEIRVETGMNPIMDSSADQLSHGAMDKAVPKPKESNDGSD